MLSYTDGKPIAKEGKQLIYLKTEDDSKNSDYDSSYDSEYDSDDNLTAIESDEKIEPLLNMEERSVAYIAGPSGSGKTTFALKLIKRFLKVYPDKPFYLFSRTDYKRDPAYKGMTVNQIMIDDSLIDEPIDVEKELSGGSIILFDDCNTIQNDKIKKQIDKLMADIMEVGRKLGIWIIITNHLVIPNEKKIARTIMNEMQSLTVFPKSGAAQQIRYALKTYYGINNKQIDDILALRSRWIMINKNYPMNVIYEHGVFII